MALFISIFLFVFLMAAVAIPGYFWYARPGRVYQQMAAGIGVQSRPETPPNPAGSLTRIVTYLQWIGERVPVSPRDASLSRRLLMAAGFRTEHVVATYYGTKVVATAALLLAVLFAPGIGSQSSALRVFLPLGAIGAGFVLPSFILERLVKRRKDTLRLSLPDALDLMVVCVEAGLGLDQAIRVVSRELHETHKEISEELSLVSLEMRAGTRRSEALNNMAQRTGESELRKLTAVLIQSDRFGTSMADSLRTHSYFLRVQRRQEAEERAHKVGVKMVFPIFFFILPSIMMVALGPAVLQIKDNLLPMIHEMQF
jgi:tight adherence protein C